MTSPSSGYVPIEPGFLEDTLNPKKKPQPRQLLSCTKCRERKVKCEFIVGEGNDYSPIQQSYEIRKLRSENQELKERLRDATEPQREVTQAIIASESAASTLGTNEDDIERAIVEIEASSRREEESARAYDEKQKAESAARAKLDAARLEPELRRLEREAEEIELARERERQLEQDQEPIAKDRHLGDGAKPRILVARLGQPTGASAEALLEGSLAPSEPGGEQAEWQPWELQTIPVSPTGSWRSAGAVDASDRHAWPNMLPSYRGLTEMRNARTFSFESELLNSALRGDGASPDTTTSGTRVYNVSRDATQAFAIRAESFADEGNSHQLSSQEVAPRYEGYVPTKVTARSDPIQEWSSVDKQRSPVDEYLGLSDLGADIATPSLHQASVSPCPSLIDVRADDGLLPREPHLSPIPLSTYKTEHSEESSSVGSHAASRSSRPTRAHDQSTTLPSSVTVPYTTKSVIAPDTDENDSVWSDDGLDPLTRARFAARLSARIERELHHTNAQLGLVAPTQAARKALAQHFASLLRHFAFLLDSMARLDMQHRSAVFVRSQRDTIVKQLMVDEGPRPSAANNMDLAEKMSRWAQSESNSLELPVDVDLSQLPPEPEDEAELDVADFAEAERFITNGVAYSWLIRHLNVALRQTIETTGEECQLIRSVLVSHISDKAKRGRRIKEVSLRLPWRPLDFMNEQYGPSRQAKLGEVVCLVGLPHMAFATTCHDYAQLLWTDLGPEVLRCLDDLCSQALKGNVVALLTVHSSRGFTLTANFKGQDGLSTDITVQSKCPVTLLEVSEVLCWAASACRSHSEPSVGHLSASLIKQGDRHVLDLQSIAMPDRTAEEGKASDDMCWTRMVHNPVLVRGYPVPKRENNEPGLEVSIGLMSILGDARRATLFDGTLVLKGFCTMFVHVARTAVSSMWHFLRSDDLSWLCYSQAKPFARCEASFDHLNVERHFVGFAHEALSLAGAKHAEYDAIDFAGERYTKSGIAFDGVTINVAKYIGAGTKCMPGNKDSAVLHAYKGPVPFRKRIAKAANMHVILYGADDQRAWFIDGASALLHLSRAALTHHRKPDIREDFDATKFKHVVQGDPACGTSKSVLLDLSNRELDLEGDGSYKFQDLVDEYLEVLLQIHAHQNKMKPSESKQWQYRANRKRRLEGFSFVDLLCEKPATRPRFINLGKSAEQWLGFVRKADAIVLMGRNFGDLLLAQSTPCPFQRSIPSGLDLLVVPIKRLQLLSEEIGAGERNTSDVQIVEGAWWHKPHESFETMQCRCTAQERSEFCEDRCIRLIAQFSSASGKTSKGKGPAVDSIFALHPDGLVVFGDRSAAREAGLSRTSRTPTVSVPQAHRDLHSSTASQAGSLGFADSGIGSSLTPSLTPDSQPHAVTEASTSSDLHASSSYSSADVSSNARQPHSVSTSPSTGKESFSKIAASSMPQSPAVGRGRSRGTWPRVDHRASNRPQGVAQSQGSEQIASLRSERRTECEVDASREQIRVASKQAGELPQVRTATLRPSYTAVAASSRSLTSPNIVYSENSPLTSAARASRQAPEYSTGPVASAQTTTAADEVSRTPSQIPRPVRLQSASTQHRMCRMKGSINLRGEGHRTSQL
ncbi:hypothetical protein LTR95_011859 [Oleoguttula sp. CCFEE 5521]